LRHLNKKLKSTEILYTAESISASAPFLTERGSYLAKGTLNREVHSNVSSEGLSVTINHNLGVTPEVVIITPKSEATNYVSAVNASQVTITTTVSGASFDVVLEA